MPTIASDAVDEWWARRKGAFAHPTHFLQLKVRVKELPEANSSSAGQSFVFACHNACSSPLVQNSRSLNFWILPDPVKGKPSTKNQCFGVLCGASEARM